MTQQLKFTHLRVTDADYRVRKMWRIDKYSVSEYYHGKLVQHVDKNLTKPEAIELAKSLADRTEF